MSPTLTACLAALAITLAPAIPSFAAGGNTPEKAKPAGKGGQTGEAKLVPIKIELPRPMFCQPVYLDEDELRLGPTLRRRPKEPRKPFLAPEGTKVISRGKKVSASDTDPIIGDLEQINDGDKEGEDDQFVELGPGLQYVQIDFGATHVIHGVVLWHFHAQDRVYHDVVAQVSDDPDFKRNVRTLFNNDHDDSSGLGAGKDYEYIERHEGRLIDAKGANARYVRCYSNGSTLNDLNHIVEVEVWGMPELVPVKIELPRPWTCRRLPRLEEGSIRLDPTLGERWWKRRKPFFAPKGTRVISRGKPVSASDDDPIIGDLDQINDGDKNCGDESFVEFGPGRQHVQIDLEAEHIIQAIVIWHYHAVDRVYHDIVVQVSDDPDFKHNIRTLFNNDHDNSAGLGVGKDYEYLEDYQGRLIDAKGAKARYVRCYTNGNTTNDMNHVTEVEVWGMPAGKAKMVPIDIKLPNWSTAHPPSFSQTRARLDPKRPWWGRKRRKPFLAPEGTRVISRGKPVSASDDDPIISGLQQINDGNKRDSIESYIEFGPGLQHVQIDLETAHVIQAIVLWHYHASPRVYHDVIVQVADDPDFVANVRTLYSNDHDNSSGLGVGKAYEYVDDHEGLLVDAKGANARYVRCYTNGFDRRGTYGPGELNHVVEVEVWGMPEK